LRTVQTVLRIWDRLVRLGKLAAERQEEPGGSRAGAGNAAAGKTAVGTAPLPPELLTILRGGATIGPTVANKTWAAEVLSDDALLPWDFMLEMLPHREAEIAALREEFCGVIAADEENWRKQQAAEAASEPCSVTGKGTVPILPQHCDIGLQSKFGTVPVANQDLGVSPQKSSERIGDRETSTQAETPPGAGTEVQPWSAPGSPVGEPDCLELAGRPENATQINGGRINEGRAPSRSDGRPPARPEVARSTDSLDDFMAEYARPGFVHQPDVGPSRRQQPLTRKEKALQARARREQRVGAPLARREQEINATTNSSAKGAKRTKCENASATNGANSAASRDGPLPVPAGPLILAQRFIAGSAVPT